MGVPDAKLTVGYDGTQLEKGVDKDVKKLEVLGKQADVAQKKLSALDKTLETVQARESGRLSTQTEKTRTVGTRAIGKIAEQEAIGLRKVVEGEQKRTTLNLDNELQRQRFIYRQHAKEVRTIDQQLAAADKFRARNRGFEFDNLPIQGPMPEPAHERKLRLVGEALVRKQQESVEKQIREADKFRTMNPNFANMRGGGRGGGIAGVLGRILGGGGGGVAGGVAAGVLGGLGIGTGGYALARGAQAAAESVAQATAYDRQRVAAEKLAGSQQDLNALLDAYAKASGGAVDKATSLGNVTRLLATGYAKTVPQLERFVRATRGASISLGKPQEEVTQETQLAISNTSIKRLDQIGLGIEEVTARIRELRAANVGMSREAAFQEAVLGLLESKYGALADSAEGQATEVEKLAAAWNNLGLAMGHTMQGPVNTAAGALNTGMGWVANQLEEGEKRRIRVTGGQFRFLDKFSEMAGFPQPTPQQRAQTNAQRILDYPGLNGWPTNTPRGDMPVDSGVMPGPIPRAENKQALIDAAYDSIEQLEKDAARSRLQEIENYESQREQIINNYGKMVVREEEDFVRQRARGLRDYERSIVGIMRDAQEREEEMQEDLDDRITDAKEDSEKRLSDMQEDYNEQREKSQKEHLDSMMKAVGQLNAIAVLEERKQFKRQQEEQRKQHDKAVDKEKESLQERIDDAIEANQERLQDAREADEKRLADMRSDRALQLADEDEDREIRKQRAAEDHQDQLDALDAAHAEALERINKEVAEKTKALEDGLAKDLIALGEYIAGVSEAMNERKELQEEWFDAMIDRMERDIAKEKELKGRRPGTYPEEVYPEYASGGFVGRTGLAYLHAGEHVLPSGLANGSSYSNSKSLVVEQINVATTPGMEYAVGQMIEDQLIELLERI